jgi:predicted SAM-dependent methyltransferase
LNTDRLRLADREGRLTEPGRLACIDRRLYYLEQDHTTAFPFADAAFDHAFSEHFIEHVSPEEAVRWLREVRRLVRAGGLLRVSTPDLRKYAAAYMNPSTRFFDQHRRALLALGARRVSARPAWMMNQLFRFWGHRWVYDIDEIRTVAMAAGFAREAVVECAFRQGRLAELCALDSPARSDESLYVEILCTPS